MPAAQTLNLFSERAGFGFGRLPRRLFRQPRFPLFTGAHLCRGSAHLSYVGKRIRCQPRISLYYRLVYRHIRLGIQYVEPAVCIPIEAQAQQLAV